MATVTANDESTRESGRVFARVATETKQAFKTTEFYVYLLAVAGVLIAAAMIGDDEGAGAGNAEAGDRFAADEAWRYITFLTIGYMISRGLAKAGSRDTERQEATLGR